MMTWPQIVVLIAAVATYLTMGDFLYGLTLGVLPKLVTLFTLLGIAAYDRVMGAILAILYMFLAQKGAVQLFEGATDLTGSLAQKITNPMGTDKSKEATAASNAATSPPPDAPIADKQNVTEGDQLQKLIRSAYCQNNLLKSGKTFPSDMLSVEGCVDTHPCDPKCRYVTSDGKELMTIEQLLRAKDSNKTVA